MGADKPNSKTGYIITIFILTLIIIGGGIYFIFFYKNYQEKTEYKPVTPDPADINDDTDATTYTKDTLFGKLTCIKDQKPDADYCKIDSDKILNAKKDVSYTLNEHQSSFENLAKIEIDKDDAKKATIKFNEKIVEQFYGEKGLNFPIYINFSSEIDSYKIAGFGQGVGDEYIFFVMKNGNVGMLSVYSMLKNKKYDPAYVKGVKDVTAIVEGGSYNEYIGGHTNYAVRNDKTGYDLQTMLPGWGATE